MPIYLLWGSGLNQKPAKNKMRKINLFLSCLLIFFSISITEGMCKLGNSPIQNKWMYGKTIEEEEFSNSNEPFSGKITYRLPKTDWYVTVIYSKGKSYSETARPHKGSTKTYYTNQESFQIADDLFPRNNRGLFKKEVKNARFISYFYDNGVVSFEMKLDSKNKSHIGVEGIRCLYYHGGTTYNTETMVNAYQ